MGESRGAQIQCLLAPISSLPPTPPYPMEEPALWDNFWTAHPGSKDHHGAHWPTQLILTITLGDQETGTPEGLLAEVGFQLGLLASHAIHYLYCSVLKWDVKRLYTEWVLKIPSALREGSLCLHALGTKSEAFQETITTPYPSSSLLHHTPNSKMRGHTIFSAFERSSQQERKGGRVQHSKAGSYKLLIKADSAFIISV